MLFRVYYVENSVSGYQKTRKIGKHYIYCDLFILERKFRELVSLDNKFCRGTWNFVHGYCLLDILPRKNWSLQVSLFYDRFTVNILTLRQNFQNSLLLSQFILHLSPSLESGNNFTIKWTIWTRMFIKIMYQDLRS